AMNEAHGSGEEMRSPSLAARVDAACDRFEAAWQAGQRPRLEDYLGDAPEPERSALARHLIAVDVEYRQKHGEQPQAAEYRARFPRPRPAPAAPPRARPRRARRRSRRRSGRGPRPPRRPRPGRPLSPRRIASDARIATTRSNWPTTGPTRCSAPAAAAPSASAT